ncbi:MAG: SEC59/DGK1/VTE5 family protein [Cyanobacteriota bacterium]|nr:SEC59/DGK1/VTE5 family protein [Cyanobacteriota bacterium]
MSPSQAAIFLQSLGAFPEDLSFSLGASILWVALYLGILLGLAELLNRLTNHPGELTRKLVHIGSGQVILLAWWLQIPGWVGFYAGLLAALVALTSYFLPILPSLESVGRRSGGTFFYALSLGGLMGYFFSRDLPQFAALGIMVMAWGDGLAGVVGQRWGRHPYLIWGQKKSWEGSVAMGGVSFLVAWLILGAGAGFSPAVGLTALAVALAAPLLETLSWYGVDNLTVPLGAAGLSYGLWIYFAGLNF